MITNGYATLSEYKTYQRITSADATDDTFIEAAIEAASRWIDRESGTRFYLATETRKYNIPLGNQPLLFDAHYQAITSVTNGDGSTITAGNFVTLPANVLPLWGLSLADRTGINWALSGTTGTIQAISITGTVGYSATAPKDIYLSCLEIAKAMYSRRFGENMATRTIITPAGVVQIPDGVPDWAAEAIANYRRVAFA